MGGRRKCPADDAALLPVNPQVRTHAGSLAKFRLCARTGLLRRNKQRLYSVALEAFRILGNRTVKVEPPLGSLSTVMSQRII
jgi:hypothetical protein